jgi:hypothetical protein
MIGVALVLIVGGVLLLFLFPWVGIAAGVAGVILLVLYFLGFAGALSRAGPKTSFV